MLAAAYCASAARPFGTTMEIGVPFVAGAAGVDDVELPDRERNEIGRQRRRALESDLAPSGVARALRLDRHVRERAHVRGHRQRELPRRLAIRLVEARQHAARIHRLELRDRIPVAVFFLAKETDRALPVHRSGEAQRQASPRRAGSTFANENPITSSLPGTEVAAMGSALTADALASVTFSPLALSQTRSVGSRTRSRMSTVPVNASSAGFTRRCAS